MNSLSEGNLLLIAGMHRSGTSFITSLCEVFGLTLPLDLMPGNQFNKPGYFESIAVYQAHERFLASIGSAWYDIAPLSTGALEGQAARVCERELSEIVARCGVAKIALAVKDPRISLLLPLWRQVASGLGLRLNVLIAVREPREVAMSLESRDAINQVVGFGLWWHYTSTLIESSRDVPNAIVSYEAVMQEPWVLYDRLVSRLAFSLPAWDTDMAAAASAKVSRDLHHNVASQAGDVPREPERRCQDLYERLLNVAGIDKELELPARPAEVEFIRSWYPEWRQLYERYLSMSAVANAARNTAVTNKQRN